MNSWGRTEGWWGPPSGSRWKVQFTLLKANTTLRGEIANLLPAPWPWSRVPTSSLLARPLIHGNKHDDKLKVEKKASDEPWTTNSLKRVQLLLDPLLQIRYLACKSFGFGTSHQRVVDLVLFIWLSSIFPLHISIKNAFSFGLTGIPF